MHGINITNETSKEQINGIRSAQKYVTELVEFDTTTKFVPTAQYAVDGTNNTTSIYTGIYHYYGRADTYYHIGQALGYGMISLTTNTTSSRTTTRTTTKIPFKSTSVVQ
jgi:hypothetical protein